MKLAKDGGERKRWEEREVECPTWEKGTGPRTSWNTSWDSGAASKSCRNTISKSPDEPNKEGWHRPYGQHLTVTVECIPITAFSALALFLAVYNESSPAHLTPAAALVPTTISPTSARMDSCNEQDIPSIAPEDLVSTPAVHISICAEVLSSTLPTGHSIKSSDPISLSPAGTSKSGRGYAGARVDEDKINAMPDTTPSLIHFVLGNFVLAMFLISLIILIVSFALTWFTVLRDARLMRDQVLSNATGVSISLLQQVSHTNGHRHGRYQCSATSSN